MRQLDRAAIRMAAVVLAAVLTCVLPASAQDSKPPASNTADELRQLLARGQYADAERRARDELTALMQSGAARSLRAAEVLDVLVVAMWRGGKASNDEAVAFAERAISLKEQLLGNADPRLATSLDNAGVLFFVRGDYER